LELIQAARQLAPDDANIMDSEQQINANSAVKECAVSE